MVGWRKPIPVLDTGVERVPDQHAEVMGTASKGASAK